MNIKGLMIKSMGVIAILVVLLVLLSVNALADETSQGCTYSSGYWKTHSIYGPSVKRDDSWDVIIDWWGAGDEESGEDVSFYGKSYELYDPMSWHDVLLAKPKKKNVYIILAQQFVAAELNVHKLDDGADQSVLGTALWEAEKYLTDYDPDINWASFPDILRDDFIRLADILDRFNNGVIGPGSCIEVSE